MALREAARHFILMTATPHAGKEEDFQVFMRLLDPSRFEGRYRPSVHAVGAEGLMLRRTKEDLLTLEGRPLFTPRAAYMVPFALSPAEQDLYNLVTAYVSKEFDRADGLERKQRNNVGFALTVLQRRLASSPFALVESLERRLARLSSALTNTKGAVRRSRSKGVDLNAIAEESAAVEREEFEEEIVVAATAARTPGELKREIAALTSLLARARRVLDTGLDRKWLELRLLLESSPEIRDSDGSVRKIIVFTEHRDTMTYLVERTRQLLGGRAAVVSIHGGLGREQRLSAQRRFTSDPQCRILIATDAAGEGLNLQSAHLMINYDLPWNPNRLEQRFGRIHRIGQKHMCHLWNLVAKNTREGDVYHRLLEKLEVMKKALGGKVFDVVGQAFEDKPLHELLIEAVRRGDQPDVREHLRQVIDSRIDEVVRRLVEQHALFPGVHRAVASQMYQRDVQHARAQRLQPHYIAAFFRDAFKRMGGTLVRREKGRWEIPSLPAALRRLERGGAVPVRYPRVCFDSAFVEGEDQPRAELIGPGRRLFDLVLRHTELAYGEALERGTVLIDRHDPTERPRLLTAIQTEIVDGDGNQVERRFGFAEIYQNGERVRGVARFLDYDAPLKAELAGLGNILREDWLARAPRAAEEWATRFELPQWYLEVNQRRRDQVARARELVTDRLKQEIAYWEEKAARAESDSTAADRGPALRAAWAEIERLGNGLERRLGELEAQEITRVNPPRVLAVATVVPQGLVDKLAGRVTRNTQEVELRAINAVVAAERRLGREPEVMEPNNAGFDITSAVAATGELIFIEVKGRIAGSETFYVTNHEIRHGQNAEHQYRLALVEVSPHGPEHDTVRYVERPFDDETVSALVKGLDYVWKGVWASGRDPW